MRGTGRTTRSIIEAVSELTKGRHVTLVFASAAEARDWLGVIREKLANDYTVRLPGLLQCGNGATLRSVSSAEFDWEVMRIRGVSGKVLVDHHAAEKKTKEIDDEIDRLYERIDSLKNTKQRLNNFLESEKLQ